MQKTDPPATARKRGRPASFDRDAAVETAMILFWRHGFEATSIGELTQAMGIAPPSLYAAFGDKKGLFREAVRRYVGGAVTSESLVDDAPTAQDAARALLETAAIGFTGKTTPRGCLLATGAISCSEDSRDLQDELAAVRRGVEMKLRQRIRRAVASGELPTDLDAGATAAHVLAVIQGMSTLARDGASREKLLGVARAAMRAWPTDHR